MFYLKIFQSRKNAQDAPALFSVWAETGVMSLQDPTHDKQKIYGW